MLPARGRRGLGAWLAIPDRIDLARPPLVAVHGVQRGARQQAEAFAEAAACQGVPVIAPIFDHERWPLYQQVVRRGRADLALLALLEELRCQRIWSGGKVLLAGYSGGAQFAHRMAMLYPTRIEKLLTIAAGWYTMPEDSDAFPYGLCDDAWGKRMADGLPEFLKIPMTVAVGALETCDEATRRRPEVDRRQGVDRLQRARAWVGALKERAGALGLPPPARLRVLPGCGHDFRACISTGGLDRRFLSPFVSEQEDV